jgi:transmembrane sensor
MSEARITLLLTRKVAGEATADELRELNELLQTNRDIIYYEEFLNELWRSSDKPTLSQEEIDKQYDKHLLKFGEELAFYPMEEDGLATGRTPKSSKLKYLLLMLPVLFIAGFLLQKKFKGSFNGTYTTIMSGKGMRKQFQLPDGTKVWLNSESQLSYHGNMLREDTRSVELIGEAFFDVTHDKSHPFIVNTDKISVRVLGTAFNVKAYPNEEKSTTTLIRGSIELSIKNVDHSKIKLKPSEKFDLIEHKESGKEPADPGPVRNITLKLDNITPLKVGGAQYTTETSWKENRLIIQNESFEELVPKLERWFGVHIIISNNNALKYRFTGIFTDEKIEEALKAMQAIKQFNFKKENNDVKIY